MDQIDEIKKSGLFDEAWYLKTYPDIKTNPIEHYLTFGANERRNPSRHFNTAYYLSRYQDVAKSGMNPLVHFIRHGKQEGRIPSSKQLSIIIPHKDATKSLSVLLKSIKEAEDFIEVYVVDDHSKPIEVARFEQLKKTYPDYHYLTSEGSFAGIARNTALKQVTTQWVLFADADDYFLPGWYDEVSKYLGSKNEIVFFPPTSKNLQTGKLGKRHLGYENLVHSYVKNPAQFDGELRLNMHPPWSKLLRMELLRRHGLEFGSEEVSNDKVFSLKASFWADPIASSPIAIYCVTEGTNTLTTTNTLERLKVRAEVLRQSNEFLKENYGRQPLPQYDCRHLYDKAIEEGFSESEIDQLLAYIHRLGLKV